MNKKIETQKIKVNNGQELIAKAQAVGNESCEKGIILGRVKEIIKGTESEEL
jgi:hypothetical protein